MGPRRGRAGRRPHTAAQRVVLPLHDLEHRRLPPKAQPLRGLGRDEPARRMAAEARLSGVDALAGAAAVLTALPAAGRVSRRRAGPPSLRVYGLLLVSEAGQAVGDAPRDSAAQSRDRTGKPPGCRRNDDRVRDGEANAGSGQASAAGSVTKKKKERKKGTGAYIAQHRQFRATSNCLYIAPCPIYAPVPFFSFG